MGDGFCSAYDNLRETNAEGQSSLNENGVRDAGFLAIWEAEPLRRCWCQGCFEVGA